MSADADKQVTDAEKPEPGVWRLRLGVLSVVLICVSVSCLATLAIVATTAEADALSTVALALAVLAFAAQLIVSLAQAQENARQTRDTLAVNADTKAALAGIRAEVQAMMGVQSQQFDRLLSHALSPENVSAALLSVTARDASDDDQEPEPVSAKDLSSALRDEVSRSRTDQGREPRAYEATMIKSAKPLLTLDPSIVSGFVNVWAQDPEESPRKVTRPQRAAVSQLVDAGLLTADSKADETFRLTRNGRWAARLLQPKRPPLAEEASKMRRVLLKRAQLPELDS